MVKTRAAFTILFLFLCTGLFAADPLLTPEQESKVNHGIGINLPADNPVKPFFTSGKVVGITEQDNNFGISVITLSEFDVTYKGNPIKEQIFVIYSNLKKTDVKINQVINDQTVIGYSGGSGTALHADSHDLFVYIYTDNHSPLMNLYTGNQFIEEDGIFWWNPEFLLKKKTE